MKDLPTLEGRLVKLGFFSENYVETYCRWMQDRYITYMTKTDENLTVDKVVGMKNFWERSSDIAYFLVFDKATFLPIGDTDLRKIKFGESAISGIMIADYRFRNKGYGSEAYSLILNYGFKAFQLKKISAYVFCFNQPAVRLHKKLGFFDRGLVRDDIVFELVRP